MIATGENSSPKTWTGQNQDQFGVETVGRDFFCPICNFLQGNCLDIMDDVSWQCRERNHSVSDRYQPFTD